MLIALTLAAALGASDPDGVMATAPADAPGAVLVGAVAPTADGTPDAARAQAVTPHGLSTDQQIARWLAGRAPEVEPFAGDDGPVDDRRVHGFVSGSIGTNDFSAVSVGVSLPVGESGRLDLSYSQTRNGWGHGYDGYGYGHGYGFGDGYGYGGYPDGPGFAPAWIGAERAHPGPGRLSGQGGKRSVRLSYRSHAGDEATPFPRR